MNKPLAAQVAAQNKLAKLHNELVHPVHSAMNVILARGVKISKVDGILTQAAKAILPALPSLCWYYVSHPKGQVDAHFKVEVVDDGVAYYAETGYRITEVPPHWDNSKDIALNPLPIPLKDNWTVEEVLALREAVNLAEATLNLAKRNLWPFNRY